MIDIDALEKLLAAATPGPWCWDLECLAMRAPAPDGPPYRKHPIIETDNGYYGPDADDAALIVALRNNAEGMIAELKVLRDLETVARLLLSDLESCSPPRELLLRKALAALDAVRKAGVK